ncbi:MAG: hypothetical protein ACPGYV_13065 [Phycisphaeraceae bacterium]
MTLSFLRFALLCACPFVAATPNPAAAEPAAYQLSVEQPEADGNYYDFKSEVARTTRTIETRNGQTVSDDSTTIQASIVGTAWIALSDGSGGIDEVVIYPNQYTGKVNGQAVELNIDERLFVQMNNGQVTAFNSAGHTLPENAIRVLSELLTFMVQTNDNQLAEDDTLALNQKRKPGQTWQANHARLAISLNKAWDIRTDPEQIQSAVNFVEVNKRFEQDAAKLDLNIELKGFDLPTLTKRGLTLDQSSATLDIQRTIPLDPNARSGMVSKQIQFTASVTGDSPEGKTHVQTTTTLTSEAEYEDKR